MSNLDILHSVYTSFYQRMKSSQDYNSHNFLNNNLREFTEAVLEDWCGNLFLSFHYHQSAENSTHSILFTVTASHNQRVLRKNVAYVPIKTRLAVLSNGDLVTFDSVTAKTGGQTYTGDVYIDNYSTTFTVKETLYNSELFNEFASLDDITSEQIEAVAVELAQEIIELHRQDTFYV